LGFFFLCLSPHFGHLPQLEGQQLVAVSDNITQLTHLTGLSVRVLVFSCRSLL